MADGDKTYTQAEYEAMVAERDALKANRDEVLGEAKRAKAALKAWDGKDPAKYDELVKAADEAERKRLAGEGDWKSLEKQLLEKHEKERGTWDTETKRLRSALDDHLIDAAALTELASHSDSPALLLPHIKRQMKVVEENGRFQARIVNELGDVRIGKGQGAAPMTLGELMEEMKGDKTYAAAFRGTGSSGGGASKSSASGGGMQGIIDGDPKSFFANLPGLAKGEIKIPA